MNENQKLGTIMKELIRFSLPLILSGVLQQLYNWADAFIVGNVDGELALSAIGVTSIPISFFITIHTWPVRPDRQELRRKETGQHPARAGSVCRDPRQRISAGCGSRLRPVLSVYGAAAHAGGYHRPRQRLYPHYFLGPAVSGGL